MVDVSKLAEAYREAESAIRSVEIITNKVPIPALNEMRYAGYHAIAFLLAGDYKQKEEEFGKSVSHCHRAYFDAQSFMLLSLYSRVKNIRDGLGEYLHFFPEMVGEPYSAKKAAVEKARAFLETLRTVRKDAQRWEKRDELYESCKPHIEACRAYIQAFESIREELCSKVDAAKAAEKKSSHSWWISAIIAIVGILTTIAAAALF